MFRAHTVHTYFLMLSLFQQFITDIYAGVNVILHVTVDATMWNNIV